MAIYITGDTHRNFNRIEDFCAENGTTKDDILIILGDACINYYLNRDDQELKKELADFPITLFMIYGNHEQRPSEIDTYEEVEWCGAVAYIEPEYPNLVFAKDGEIYDLDGRSAIAIGGAYSIDATQHDRWFPLEQPTEDIMDYVERQLERVNWRVDIVLSHTVPLKYLPTYALQPGLDQSKVDKTTEEWLDTIEDRLDYDEWYAGHYHTESQEGPIRIMYEDYDEIY